MGILKNTLNDSTFVFDLTNRSKLDINKAF